MNNKSNKRPAIKIKSITIKEMLLHIFGDEKGAKYAGKPKSYYSKKIHREELEKHYRNECKWASYYSGIILSNDSKFDKSKHKLCNSLDEFTEECLKYHVDESEYEDSEDESEEEVEQIEEEVEQIEEEIEKEVEKEEEVEMITITLKKYLEMQEIITKYEAIKNIIN